MDEAGAQLASSWATRLETVVFGTPSRRPAAVKPPLSAACTKKRRSFRFSMIIVHKDGRQVSFFTVFPVNIHASKVLGHKSEESPDASHPVLTACPRAAPSAPSSPSSGSDS